MSKERGDAPKRRKRFKSKSPTRKAIPDKGPKCPHTPVTSPSYMRTTISRMKSIDIPEEKQKQIDEIRQKTGPHSVERSLSDKAKSKEGTPSKSKLTKPADPKPKLSKENLEEFLSSDKNDLGLSAKQRSMSPDSLDGSRLDRKAGKSNRNAAPNVSGRLYQHTSASLAKMAVKPSDKDNSGTGTASSSSRKPATIKKPVRKKIQRQKPVEDVVGTISKVDGQDDPDTGLDSDSVKDTRKSKLPSEQQTGLSEQSSSGQTVKTEPEEHSPKRRTDRGQGLRDIMKSGRASLPPRMKHASSQQKQETKKKGEEPKKSLAEVRAAARSSVKDRSSIRDRNASGPSKSKDITKADKVDDQDKGSVTDKSATLPEVKESGSDKKGEQSAARPKSQKTLQDKGIAKPKPKSMVPRPKDTQPKRGTSLRPKEAKGDLGEKKKRSTVTPAAGTKKATASTGKKKSATTQPAIKGNEDKGSSSGKPQDDETGTCKKLLGG